MCTKDSTTITFHSKLVATGDSNFHLEAHTTYSPPIGALSEVNRVTDMKWLGSCSAGEQPEN